MSRKGIFSSLIYPVADSSGKYSVPRKVLTNAQGYPYRKARLVDYGGDVTKNWYLIFYAWDIGLNKLCRKRLGKVELNSIRHLKQRREKARELIKELNEELQNGGYLETYPKDASTEENFNFKNQKLLAAFTYVENLKKKEKKSRSTVRGYSYTRNTLEAFLVHEKIDKDIELRQVTIGFIHRYAQFLLSEKKLSNKTYNDRINNLYACFEVLRKLDLRLWPNRNPVDGFEKLKVTQKTHAAYTEKQLGRFVEIIAPENSQILLLIRFIFYTLARPNELRFLKVGHIRMDFLKILIVGETAKNDVEQYVGVSGEFARIINESRILTYPQDYYVFSIEGHPGPTHVGTSYFYKTFKPFLKETGFRKINPLYTMYSFKHSGAIQLYLATKDPYLVQKQLRHGSLEQTMEYLKDLGLFVDFTALKEWKGF